MEDLTPNEVARLHLKARHGTLTPEEQQVYSDYMARQIASAQPPAGGEPPKHGKPKRNVDIPNVLGKIAGIAVIVAALVILGPPIARYGLELVDSAIEYRDSMNTRLDAQQSGNAHYVATSHEAGTIDYKRSDLFISGEYFIAIKSDAHYGILSIACGAYDADAPDKTDKYHTVPDYFDERGGIGMSVVDGSRDGWTIRDDELRSVLEAHGLSYDTFCSNTAAFNLGEDELADLTSQVASVITYGDIASYPVDDDTSFTYTLDGHAYQDDADMDEWVVFAGGVVGASYPDSFALNGSNDNPQMFADAQPTSSVE